MQLQQYQSEQRSEPSQVPLPTYRASACKSLLTLLSAVTLKKINRVWIFRGMLCARRSGPRTERTAARSADGHRGRGGHTAPSSVLPEGGQARTRGSSGQLSSQPGGSLRLPPGTGPGPPERGLPRPSPQRAELRPPSQARHQPQPAPRLPRGSARAAAAAAPRPGRAAGGAAAPWLPPRPLPQRGVACRPRLSGAPRAAGRGRPLRADDVSRGRAQVVPALARGSCCCAAAVGAPDGAVRLPASQPGVPSPRSRSSLGYRHGSGFGSRCCAA